MKNTEQYKDELYRDYHNRVFAYVASRLNDRDYAEDITADVFVKVYEKLETYDEKKSSVSTWIYTITRNTLIDYFRTNHISSELSDEMESDFSIEDTITRDDMLEKLTIGLKSLTERERDIIILRFYSGKTLKEIADTMSISYAYIKVLQNNAFEKMKKFLV